MNRQALYNHWKRMRFLTSNILPTSEEAWKDGFEFGSRKHSFEYHTDGTSPPENQGWIFVFGSNLGGIHGAGAAKHALKWGAKIGVGVGPQGNSYAIPTKNKDISGSLPLETINGYVQTFIEYAQINSSSKFFVTRIGCVLAGYSDELIAPMFYLAPPNCSFAKEWAPFLS